MSHPQQNDMRRFANLSQPPDEALCSRCRERQGTIRWGDALAMTHGFVDWRCEICALEEQIKHARERAKRVPVMERKLARLKAREDRRKSRS